MEKYIFALILIIIFAFAFCTYPTLFAQADNAYIVTKNSFAAEKILTDYKKWQANDFFVYKLETVSPVAHNIPDSKFVYEYYFFDENIIKMDSPLMQVYSSGDKIICGIPYVID